MKAWKKLLLIANVVVLSVILAGCGKSGTTNQQTEEMGNTASTATPVPTQEATPSAKSFLPTEDYVRSIGRTMTAKEALWLVHSGTGMEFTFTGTNATIKIKPDSSFMTRSNQARFAIYVNGERIVDDMADKMEKGFILPLYALNLASYNCCCCALSAFLNSTIV